jgi:superfamily II DNA/RNA helicase
VAQHLTWTDMKGKRDALRRLLRNEDVKNAVIFCNRKRDIGVLIRSLTRHGFDAVALHGDMSQSARLEALQKFKDGEVPLLIASDVAARGLDIAGLSHVFNFDVPSSAEDYVHRIGRTGRAGKSGRAFTIAAGKDDQRYVSAIEKLIGKPIPLFGDTPDKGASAADEKPAARKSRSQSKTGKAAETTADKKNDTPAATSKPVARSSRSKKDGKAHSGGNRNRADELPSPPDCVGNTLEDTGHIPAFLTR